MLCIEDNPSNLQLIDSVLGMLPDVRLINAIAPEPGAGVGASASA